MSNDYFHNYNQDLITQEYIKKRLIKHLNNTTDKEKMVAKPHLFKRILVTSCETLLITGYKYKKEIKANRFLMSFAKPLRNFLNRLILKNRNNSF